MAESACASVDSGARGAGMTAPPLPERGADQGPSIRVVDPEICLFVSPETAALKEETQVVMDEDQDSEDLAPIMTERAEGEYEILPNAITGVTLHNEDLNHEELFRHKNSRASLSEFFPPLDVGDAKYQSLVEENRHLQKRLKDSEEAGKRKDEEIRGLKEQVMIQAGVISGSTCCRR